MTYGNVTLLGAGCGKGLMTVAGMEVLKKAEVVIYDDLIDPELLLETKSDCELIYVGKRFARHSEKQEKIQQILIEKAREGKQVVRLKGGDSFVFGRGGEEMEALKEAKIPAQVIPGISSGIAVPEHLGIPVTHRGMAQTMTFITGHVAAENHIDYEVLAKMDGTLVFFMGLHHAGEIAERLMAGGKDPKTPAAILSDGYGAGEAKVTGTLRNLSEMAKEARTPALILVGQVAALDYASTVERPLSGASVTVTGTRYFTERLGKLLTEEGAFVVKKPGIEIVPLEENFPDDYGIYQWVAFTSANGVRGFFDHLKKTGMDLRRICHLKFACIGSGSAKMLKSYGFTADLVPEDYTAEALGMILGQRLSEQTTAYESTADSSHAPESLAKKTSKLLILRADNGSKLLNVELDKAGVIYDDRKIYTTRDISQWIQTQREEQTEYVVFASANGARIHLQKSAAKKAECATEAGKDVAAIPASSKIVCIGEATASVLAEFGIDKSNATILIPESHTAEAIVEVIRQDFCKNL